MKKENVETNKMIYKNMDVMRKTKEQQQQTHDHHCCCSTITTATTPSTEHT